MKVLLTGGAGYIGSHAAVELLDAGHSVVIVDNLANSSEESVHRIEKITNKPVVFFNADVRDRQTLDDIFKAEKPDAVIHFAGLKAVGESVEKPLEYYDNNINSSLVLLEVMRTNSVKKLVFSSSATVYGSANYPYREDMTVGIDITNPYGWTKFIIEQIIQDEVKAWPNMEVSILRYFNPVGAHESGLIGEDPKGTPNNLMPYVSQVTIGTREYLNIFGDDYDTPDGTGVRDYIHVVDLARGHVEALNKIKPGIEVFNLGSGKGTSVLEMVRAFEKASNKPVPYKICPRRVGDLAACYADTTKAKTKLDWQTEKTIDDMCRDSWNWQSQNPDGYRS